MLYWETEMRKAVRIIIILFLSVEILTLLAPSLVVKGSVGISTGTSLTFGTSDGSPWVTMNPSDAPPLTAWKSYMNFTTISFSITSISGNLIGFNETDKYRNGTTKGPLSGHFNVNSGFPSGIFFVRAGLGEGDRIYPGNSNNTYVINATWTDHTHWDGREICVLNYTLANVSNETSVAAVRRTVVYWDRLTGVLLSAFEEASAVDNQGNYLEGYLLFQLIGNNIRIPMDYSGPIDMTPIYIVIGTAATVAIGAVIVRVATSKPEKKHKRLKG
jgi:hypothetical protein